MTARNHALAQVKGWAFGDILLETREGPPPDVPPHAHDGYQIGFTTRDTGWYYCEGRRWLVPPHSVVLFHPGEVHSVQEGAALRVSDQVARAAYLPPERLIDIASSISANKQTFPHFSNRVIVASDFVAQFVRTHELLESQVGALEKEEAVIDMLTGLITRFANLKDCEQVDTRDKFRTRRVRDFIDANYADDVSLSDLAEMAAVSPFHLSRMFKREIGMPPHAYQSQVRVERAKTLLLRGAAFTDAALEVGFFDQSHLGRHFRKILGVAPSAYLRMQ